MQKKPKHLELGSWSFTVSEQVVSGYFSTVNFYSCHYCRKTYDSPAGDRLVKLSKA